MLILRPAHAALVLVFVLTLAAAPITASAQGPSAAGYAEPGANVLPPPPTVVSVVVPATPPPATITLPPPPLAESDLAGDTAGGSGPDRPTDQATVSSLSSESTPVQTRSIPASATALPFTGADVGFAALAGAMLLTLGLVLRHSTRRRTG